VAEIQIGEKTALLEVPAEYKCPMLGKGAFAFTILQPLFSISQDSYERKTPLKPSSLKNQKPVRFYIEQQETQIKPHSRTKANKK